VGGAAFVFAESGGTWSEQQVMTPPDGVALNFFGSVAVSGNIAMVGAYGESVGPNPFPGSVYVFGSSGPLYTLSATPSSLSVAEGGEGTSTIAITPWNGFSGNVSFSALGLPSGITATFNPNPGTSTSMLTLTASPTAAAGTTTPFLVGTSGSLAQTVPLTLAALITPSPPSLNFGNVAINSISTAKTVTFTNRGTTKIGFIIINVTPSTNFAVFLVTGYTCTNGHLAPGQSCVVKVEFEPTALGPVTGTLSFTDDGPGSPQTTALSGAGIAEATLIPASVEFSKQEVGTTSAAKAFALINNQTVALTNIAISTTGDFAESATTCGTSLAAKTKCTVSVTFTPTATGTRSGQLSVSDSASNSPQTAALTGTGKQD
jgi:hypothetical protein